MAKGTRSYEVANIDSTRNLREETSLANNDSKPISPDNDDPDSELHRKRLKDASRMLHNGGDV